ncbi:MAG: hypothetical protein ACEQSF_01060 [Solirubrobacteraceae bacterium]
MNIKNGNKYEIKKLINESILEPGKILIGTIKIDFVIFRLAIIKRATTKFIAIAIDIIKNVYDFQVFLFSGIERDLVIQSAHIL